MTCITGSGYIVEGEITHGATGDQNTAVIVARTAACAGYANVFQHLTVGDIGTTCSVNNGRCTSCCRCDDRIACRVASATSTINSDAFADRHIFREGTRRHLNQGTGCSCSNAWVNLSKNSL